MDGLHLYFLMVMVLIGFIAVSMFCLPW